MKPDDLRAFSRQLIEQFRATGGVGRLGPVDFARLAELTTRGRQHTVAVGYARDPDGHPLLFASSNAAARDPDWYRNIEADPRVHIEITGAAWDADAETLTGAERDDAYRRWIEMAPHVADHEERTGRRIPLVRVRRPPVGT